MLGVKGPSSPSKNLPPRAYFTMHCGIIGVILGAIVGAVVGLVALVNNTQADGCPCGWELSDQLVYYTHRLSYDFSDYAIDVDSVLNNPLATDFNKDWMIYDH
jgi:hypothetical protein